MAETCHRLGRRFGLGVDGTLRLPFSSGSSGFGNRFILPAARLPIFFIGVYAGHWLSPAHLAGVVNKRRFKAALLVLTLISLVSFFYMLNAWGFNGMRNSSLLYFLFVPILPGAMTAMVEAFRWIEQRKSGGRVLSLLRLLGQGTLEAYLLIGLTYGYVNKVSAYFHVSPLIANVLLMFMTILLALLIHIAVTRFVDWTSRFLQRARRQD